MGKERTCMHDCSDGFEEMRRSPGVKKAAKRLFPLFRIFKADYNFLKFK